MRVYHDFFFPDPDQRFLIRIRNTARNNDKVEKLRFSVSDQTLVRKIVRIWQFQSKRPGSGRIRIIWPDPDPGSKNHKNQPIL